jgi:hypothetical protein
VDLRANLVIEANLVHLAQKDKRAHQASQGRLVYLDLLVLLVQVEVEVIQVEPGSLVGLELLDRQASQVLLDL